MTTHTESELRLAKLLVEALDLEDITAEDIVPDAPLFDPSSADSLGLDSIDALEISLAVAKKYQVQLKADDEANKEIFASLRSLNEYIESQLTS
jgi:acyl carrier protein